MEFNVRKRTKPDFSNFVALTLENRMPWKTLNSLLFDLAPTLNEPREIIGILLKELEEKELTKYENSTLTANILKSNIKHQKITLETEIEENEQVSCTPTNETIEDEIEVLKVVKENINKEILLVMNQNTKLSETFVNNKNDKHDSSEAGESISKIDNQWDTFVKDSITIVPQTEASVQEKEFCPETEPTSFIESETNKHMAEENMPDADMSVNEIDNEWYT